MSALARVVIAAGVAAGCTRASDPPPPGPALQIVGESTRVRLDDPRPASSPWFDGERVRLVAARGEVLGIQVLHRDPGPSTLAIGGPAIEVHGFSVEAFPVVRPSSGLFGGSRGRGRYADALEPSAAPATDPAYFEIRVAADAEPDTRTGELVIGGRTVPVELAIAPVTLPPLPIRAWAYADPREVIWASEGLGERPAERDRAVATPAERACIAMFRGHGVLLSPDLRLEWWPARRELLDGFPHVPVVIPSEPAAAAVAARGWIAATAGTGQVPFSIPIDEPRTAEARGRVRALADAVRAAGGGPGRFQLAVTAEPHRDFGDHVDLYIGLRAAHLDGDAVQRWTYNGAPPYAGNVALDAASPGTRTWGWIGWRWRIPVWYVWDALYWHDRHNLRGAPFPGRALDPRADPVSFDDGEDRGNLDGVLALPAPGGCRPTLRLAALRRGMQDRSLLELASACDATATARLAAELVPAALGDAPLRGKPSWPTDEAAWERARRRLIELASCAR
ncbi:MAG: hypothetical protein ACTHU0_20215 [Kofleriaceae bacterium]